MKLLGAVLAGGRSSRFGSDKAMAVLDGRALLDHAIEALAPLSAEVVVCGQARLGLRSLDDRPMPGLGPLGGINAALALARDEGFDAVLSLPCDAPGITPAMLAALIAQRDEAAAFEDLPVCGVWPARLAPLLDAHLAGGDDRSMRGWVARCDARLVPGPGIVNVNTLADLARAAAGR